MSIAPGMAFARVPLPRLFSHSLFHGGTTVNVFEVRPQSVVTDSADGGELVIHWQRWTDRRASGTGRAYPDHGSYPIRVTASRPISGYFTRVTVLGRINGRWRRDPLGLCALEPVQTPPFLSWFNVSWMRNPAAGCAPWPA